MPSNPYRRRIPPERVKQLLAELDAPKIHASAAAPAPEEDQGFLEKYGPTGIRALGAFLGVTPAKAFGAGAVTETLAEGLEKAYGNRKSFSPAEIGTAGVLGGLGGGAVRAITRNISNPIKAALRAAPWAAAQPVARSVLEEGELPSPGEVATNVAITGAGAYGMGKLAEKLGLGKLGYPTPPKAAEAPVPEGPASLVDLIKGKTPKDIEALAMRTEAAGGVELANLIRKAAVVDAGVKSPVSASRLISANRAAQKAENAANVAAAKSQAAAAEESRAGAKIEAAKAGLVKKEQVSETINAPTEGGKKTLKTIFQKKKEPRPRLTKITEVPPEGTPQRDIYQEWIAAGRDPKVALRLAISGRKRLTQAPAAAEAAAPEIAQAVPEAPPQAPLPRTPEEVAAYMESKRAGTPQVPEVPVEAPAAPTNPLEDLLRTEPTSAPEVHPQAPVEAPEANLAPAPEPTPEISALQRFLAGESLPEGPLRPPSAKGAQAIAEAQGKFSPEANQKLDDLRRVLNFSSGEERGEAARLMREIQGKEMGVPPGTIAQPLGPKAPPAVPAGRRASPPSKLRPEEVRAGIMDEAEKLLEQGVPEEEAINQAKASFMDRLRKLAGEGGAGGGESGAVDPGLLYRLGSGGVGAAIGATYNEDDPVTGAVLGGVAGAAIPSVISRMASKIAPELAGNPEVSEVIAAAGSKEGMAGTVQNILGHLPNVLRANLLISPNLLNNAITGPWGSMVMTGLELHLSGDPRGMRLIAAANPRLWAEEFQRSAPEAAARIGRAEGESLEAAPGLGRKLAALPGTFMTMGDVTSRNLAMKIAGLTEEEALRMTGTAEPEYLQAIVNIQRNIPGIGHIILPFARTMANYTERGLERTPLVGSYFQGLRKVPDSFAAQAGQQALGAASIGAGYLAGAHDPTEDMNSTPLSKIFRGAVTNAAGPYTLLAGAGFAAGKAKSGGSTNRKAALMGVNEAMNTLPLPSLDVPSSYARFALAEPGKRKMPSGLMPTLVKNIYEGEYRKIPPENLPLKGLFDFFNNPTGGSRTARPSRRRPRGSR